MKFYNDKNKVILVQTIASANTYVSSITGIIKNHILKAFPKSYFKRVYVDTSETFQEQNKNELYNKFLHKIPYPSLTITPSLSVGDSVTGLKNILMSSPNFWIPRDVNRVYPSLLEDPNGKYKINFTSDYISLNLMFRITTDSFKQATNIGYWLKSRFDDNIAKYLSNQYIQVEVPKTLVNVISKIENLFTGEVDYVTNNEDLKKLDEILLGIGQRPTPIIRKKSLSTGKDCYFFEEKQNLLTYFTDLDIPESVSRDSSVSAEYEISFRVQVSGWWTNAFIMTINRDEYRLVEHNIDLSSSLTEDSGFYSTNISTKLALDRKNVINFEDSEGNIHYGHNVVHEVLVYEKKQNITTINLVYLFDPLFLKLHSYCLYHGLNLTSLFFILCRTYSGNSETVGIVDYENLCINFDNPVDTDMILDIFINRAEIDALLEEMDNDVFYNNDYALTTLNISNFDSDEPEKIRIYSFDSDEHMKTTEMDKSLRIMTKYGIGFIGLVREGENNASDYKVCLGYDKYNNPIIRCLEKV